MTGAHVVDNHLLRDNKLAVIPIDYINAIISLNFLYGVSFLVRAVAVGYSSSSSHSVFAVHPQRQPHPLHLLFVVVSDLIF